MFAGYAGNSLTGTTYGGGTNFLCLHNDPVLQSNITTVTLRGSIRGVEYNFENSPFSTANNGGLNFTGKDMPCVVCNAETRSYQIMIPARSDCPAGWTLEYWGYLISSYTTSASNYICLDNSPEIIVDSVADVQSNNAFPVGSFCGSTFSCPPYVDYFAIPCVVCSI